MKTALHLQDADSFYEQLLDAHQGLSPEQSQLLNARLILLLANHVGDLAVLREAIALARRGAARQGLRDTPGRAIGAGADYRLFGRRQQNAH